MLRLILCFSLCLAACHGDDGLPPAPANCSNGQQASAFKTVRIWVQDDPDLGTTEASAGLDLWKEKCLKGEIVRAEFEADVRFTASHIACVRNDKSGGFTLATSIPGGKIVMFVECLRDLFKRDSDGHISRLILKLVMAHELGHEAGMWFHVPKLCDETEAKSDFEKDLVRMGVCGRAIMNSFINQDQTHITGFDSEAYDLRDADSSTFPHLDAMPDGCVLTYWPPQ
jgi:hypothetical protein